MPMARTLNIDDKSVELAIPLDIIGPSVIDISKLYGQPRVSTYDPGFTSPAACESKITYIDAGILFDRGYTRTEQASPSRGKQVAPQRHPREGVQPW